MRSAACACLVAAVAAAAVSTATYAGPAKRARPTNQVPKLPIIQTGLVPGGDKFYLLAYEGENYRQVWYQGAIDSRCAFIGDELAMQGEVCCDQCSPVPSKSCRPHEGPEGRERWWLELRLPTGKLGWTHQPELFNEREYKFCTKRAASHGRR